MNRLLQLRWLLPTGLLAVLAVGLLLYLLLRPGDAPTAVDQPAAEHEPAEEQDPRAHRALELPVLDFEHFELGNGLEVILHRDPSRPLVAVGLWYRVGSSYEWQGRTGLAHLIEHLMFEGSVGNPQNYFGALEDVGVTDINGTTNRDRTNYFQTVPKEALDRVLWLESDRMAWMLVDGERLPQQVSAVKNEKATRENRPYGTAWNYLRRLLYGDNHPYSWSILGSDADLDAATTEDVQRFRSAWYSPNNAVLVLAGDLDFEAARASVETWFGPIPAGPELDAPAAELPQLQANRRAEVRDKVPHARIYRSWIVPGAEDVARTSPLYLACRLLGSGRRSLLHRRLVRDTELANFARCYSQFGKLSGEITLVVEARQGDQLQRLESELDQLVEEFLRSPPDADEMHRLVQADIGSMLRSLDRLGGYGGRMAQLAEGAALTGDPRLWEREFAVLQGLGPGQLLQSAQQWLSRPWAQLKVLPGAEPASPPPNFTSEAHLPMPELLPRPEVASGRAGLPSVLTGELPEIPEAEQWLLSGDCPQHELDCVPTRIALYLVHRAETPLVSLDLQFPCQRSGDLEPAGLPDFTTHVMSQGTETRNALAIEEMARDLAAVFRLYAHPDYCGLAASVPAQNLSEALPLIEEMAFRPRFYEVDLERERQLWINGIAGEYSSARTLALRLLPPLIYGGGHSYGVPATGTGYRVQIGSLLRDELRTWHRRVFRRDKGSLILAGDFADEQRKSELLGGIEALFGGRAERREAQRSTAASAGCSPFRHRASEQDRQNPRLIFVPAPGRTQSVIAAGQTLPDRDRRGGEIAPGACTRVAMELANEAFGGSFTARLNRWFRLDKGWSYGARSLITDPEGTPALMAFTSVQADQTAQAVADLLHMARDFNGGEPLRREEWQRARNALLRQLPGSLESLGALRRIYSRAIGKSRTDPTRSPSWWSRTRMQLIRDLRLSEIRQQSQRIRPQDWTLVLIGDPSVLDSLRQLGLGEPEVQELTPQPAPAVSKPPTDQPTPTEPTAPEPSPTD